MEKLPTMESKVVSIHAVKAYRGSRGVAPLVIRHVYKIARRDYRLRRASLLSVRMEQLPSHWMEFHQILYRRNFGKICRENSYLLTPWGRVLLEKLTGFAASQEIPRIFGTRRFITVLTNARHLSLS